MLQGRVTVAQKVEMAVLAAQVEVEVDTVQSEKVTGTEAVAQGYKKTESPWPGTYRFLRSPNRKQGP